MNLHKIAPLLVLMLAGCAAGPDFQRPAAPALQAYRPTPTQIADQRLVSGAAVPERWWESFQSAALNALVEQALAANPSLDAARSALLVAQENAAAQRGAFWPQLGLGLNPSRQKVADTLSSPLNNPLNPFSLHTGQLTVSYAPDIFGGNRRALESLDAQAEAQAFELEAARLSLAANVAATAVQEAALRGQLVALENVVGMNQELLDLARRQQALGDLGEAGVAAQEAALAQTRAALPPLRKQLAQTRDQLIALCGGFPDQATGEGFTLAQLQLPEELPLSLPSTLIDQRPDVRAAEAQAHAASAQIGVAFANMLPQFNLDASVGSVAARMGDLLKAGGGAGFWTVAGTLSQPLFAGGALSHRKAAAEAAYDQAMAQYRATVIGALQNVADTLHALEQDAAADQETQTAQRAAARSLALARRQAELGEISHLTLLNAEQSYQLALLAAVQAKANRYTDSIALFQALGGGWRRSP